jgi:hypothetical protein
MARKVSGSAWSGFMEVANIMFLRFGEDTRLTDAYQKDIWAYGY